MSTSSMPGARVVCLEPGCIVTFARIPDMHRHLDEVHGDTKYCDEPGCIYPGTKRPARLRDHRMKCHPHLYNSKSSLGLPLNLEFQH
jgi:hypothetical protein